MTRIVRPRPAPPWCGWWRARPGDPWQQLARGYSAADVLRQLWDAAAGPGEMLAVKGGEAPAPSAVGTVSK